MSAYRGKPATGKDASRTPEARAASIERRARQRQRQADAAPLNVERIMADLAREAVAR